MSDLERILHEHDSWLLVQPEFRDSWTDGCRWLADEIQALLEGYASTLLNRRLEDEERFTPDSKESLRTLVVHAFLYHWRSACETSGNVVPVEGESVLGSLKKGILPTMSSRVHRVPYRLGGDPLRDVFLAFAATLGVDEAVDRIQVEYEPLFQHEARRASGYFSADVQWNDFFAPLVCRWKGKNDSDLPPKLSHYHGYTSLRAWLRPVARNFVIDVLRDVARRGRRMTLRLEAIPAANEPPEPDIGEALRWAKMKFFRAAERLRERDWEILQYNFRFGWRNQDVAAELQVSPGHASRLSRKATEEWYVAWQNDPEPAPPEWIELHLGEGPSGQGLLESLFQVFYPAGVTTEEGSILALVTMQSSNARPTSVTAPAVAGDSKVNAKKKLGEKKPDKQAFFVEWPVDQEPRALVRRFVNTPPKARPAILGLDARGATEALPILRWLEKLDGALSEQQDNSVPVLFLPRIVVALKRALLREIDSIWLNRSDFTWLADDQSSRLALPDLYRHYVHSAMQLSLAHHASCPPSVELSEEEKRDLQPLEPHIPPSQIADWNELMEGLKTWSTTE